MSQNYHICRHLDEPCRLIIFTLDEAFGLITSFLIGFITGFIVSGLIIGALWVMGMRYLKKGKGTSFLLQLMYWFLPHALTRYVFGAFANSADRHFLS